MRNLPKEVIIKEVGPRDGLQNEKEWIPTENKIAWINMLSNTGVKEIEYTSFVNPKMIPALKDAKEVGRRIERNPDVCYSALVPNMKGLEFALEAGIDRASVFMSASEMHNQKNINKSIADTYPILEEVIKEAKAAGKRVTGYVSTVFDCPYQGDISPEQVLEVCLRLTEAGADDLSLGDTIGSAVPTDVEKLLEVLLKEFPKEKLILHYHDTRGMAMANIMTSLHYGISRFDGTVGGLGGCPYAKGATGNVDTNDMLYLLHGIGMETGINEKKMQQAGLYIQRILGKRLPSRSLEYIMNA